MPLRPDYTVGGSPEKLALYELVGWVGFNSYYLPKDDGSINYTRNLNLALKDITDALQDGVLVAKGSIGIHHLSCCRSLIKDGDIPKAWWAGILPNDILDIKIQRSSQNIDVLEYAREIHVLTADVHKVWPPVQSNNSIPPVPELAPEMAFVIWATAEKKEHGHWPPTDTEKTGQRLGWRQWASTNGVDRDTVKGWVESYGFSNQVGRPKSVS